MPDKSDSVNISQKAWNKTGITATEKLPNPSIY